MGKKRKKNTSLKWISVQNATKSCYCISKKKRKIDPVSERKIDSNKMGKKQEHIFVYFQNALTAMLKKPEVKT